MSAICPDCQGAGRDEFGSAGNCDRCGGEGFEVAHKFSVGDRVELINPEIERVHGFPWDGSSLATVVKVYPHSQKMYGNWSDDDTAYTVGIRFDSFTEYGEEPTNGHSVANNKIRLVVDEADEEEIAAAIASIMAVNSSTLKEDG